MISFAANPILFCPAAKPHTHARNRGSPPFPRHSVADEVGDATQAHAHRPLAASSDASTNRTPPEGKISSMSKSTRISASYNSKSERALRAKERRAQVALSIDRLAQVLGINKKSSESYIANVLEETLAYIKGMEALPGI